MSLMLHTSLRALSLWFRKRRFLKGFYHIWAWRPSWSSDQDTPDKFSFPLNIETSCEIWLWLAEWLLRRKQLKIFPYMIICKTSDPRAEPFWPQGYNLTIFWEFHKIKLHSKYQRPGLLVSDKWIFESLPIGVYVTNLGLSVKRSRSKQGHYFFKFHVARVRNTAYQALWSLALWFQKRSFWVFIIYGHDDHLDHVTKMWRTNFRSPGHEGTIWNLALIGQVVSEEKTFEECGRRTDEEVKELMMIIII